MCGEWREAQVDLRAAWYLDNSLTWAKELAEHNVPPAHLFIALGGPGPEPVWNPEFQANPLRSERKVSFRLRGRKSPMSMADQRSVTIESHRSPDAGPWYERHLVRESELHEVILDSAYGGKAAVHSTIAGSKIAATTGLGLAIGIGGTALGAAVIYYGNTADAITAGLVIAGTSIEKGMQLSREGYQESTYKLKQELDPSTGYRFVRYLPEYLWMGWSDEAISYPVELRTPTAALKIKHPNIENNGTSVSVAFLPDTLPSCSYKIDNDSFTFIPLRNAAGNCF
jgi:hypothetical protein